MARSPVSITPILFDEICECIASGDSIRSICLRPGMPTMANLFNYLRESDAKIVEQYSRAKQDCADAYAEEMIDVAHQEPGMITSVDEDGVPSYRVDSGEVQNRRLLIDTLKWTASKLKPKVYGDKITQEHTGTVTLEGLITGSQAKE